VKGPSSCKTCGTAFDQKPGRGRPQEFCCAECRDWHYAKETLIKTTASVMGRSTQAARVEVWYELYCFVADEIPRVRYPAGHPRAGDYVARHGNGKVLASKAERAKGQRRRRNGRFK
jgi:hypothetical protein